MKIEKTETKLENVTNVVQTNYYCDWCGTEIMRSYYSKELYKFKLQIGDSYPSGGYTETEQAYFCKTCANKVKKLLENEGIKFNKTEFDW